MLSVLLCPLLGRCNTNVLFRRRALFCGLEAALILKLFWDLTSKSIEIKAASMQL